MAENQKPLNVTIVSTPDAQVSPLSGLYETFMSFGLLSTFDHDVPQQPFNVEIVSRDDAGAGVERGASGLPTGAHRPYWEVKHTDIVIVPLMMLTGPDWITGRYPGMVSWLRRMNGEGALLCSTCTGVLLLAETGLLDGRDATIHWAFASTFERNFPEVNLRTQEVLISSGDRDEFVMTGGVMSWHDLALHLITRYVGPTAAQGMAKLLMLQRHDEGQSPYIAFAPRLGHGDDLVLNLQNWLQSNFRIPNSVEELVAFSGLTRRSFERRFRTATGLSPLTYVQKLRVEEARRQLERSNLPVELVAEEVGYENTAFFRRIFERTTRLTPGEYRRRFSVHPVATESETT